jgi:hypothetical protein
MWITKEGYALKQIDVTVGKQANINFLERIKIQQELEPTTEGAWLPVKNRVLIDIGELSTNSAGMLAKFYTSNKNIIVNKPFEVSFYERPILMDEAARINQHDETVWDTLRHEALSETERNVYKMIDTLSSIPIIRTYTDIIKIVVDGYIAVGKTKRIELGPYSDFLSYNNLEGIRLMPGFRTTYAFNKKWTFGGQLGYGFLDERYKYSFYARHLISKKRWTSWSLRVRSDLGRLGFDDEAVGSNALLMASQRWGFFRRGYYFDEARLSFQRELFKGFNQKITFRHNTFEPAFDFGYFRDPNDILNSDTLSRYSASEVILEARYARDEIFLIDDNQRVSMGTLRWPILTLRYTRGLRGVAGSDFEYNKLKFMLQKGTRLGIIGTGTLRASAEYIFEPLPYPLLGLHLGNQTPVFTSLTFNLMNFGEFVSDRYVTAQYNHHFEGLFLNHLPLLRKLKWRLVGSANVAWGGMSSKSKALLIPDATAFNTSTDDPTDVYENRMPYFKNGKPYVEVGYGIENIFKFFRIDFVHRLTYLDHEVAETKARAFGVFGSVQLTL